MANDKLVLVIIILSILSGYLYYEYPKDLKAKYEQLQNDYNKLNQEHQQLSISYNELNNKYNDLKKENEELKVKQKELTEEIASYLLEQAAIDIFGLRKYNLAYDLVKIAICNKQPTFVLC